MLPRLRITQHRAFTLIELFVVMGVIAILATLAIPVLTSVTERARVVQDLNNLRQIGVATQLYLNDNDNTLFSAATPWMKQLHPKYLSAWKIFQSPFDNRTAIENDTTSPISYGLNGNTKNGSSSIAGLAIEKIANSSAFIIIAPAQTSAVTIAFSGTANQAAPGVTVYKNSSTPGGNYAGTDGHGTHNKRTRINALFADLHTENMLQSTFSTDTGDATALVRWDPYTPYP